jgi:glycosyltransferase involved in cell wall biosynthesis
VLRAFAIIQKEVPDATLNGVGDGSQRQRLEDLARELKLRNTTFRGQVDPSSIADVYDAADIYLNGSEIDNQPLSLLEAFACGLPIVTTDAGGIPDIVSDHQTGMVVPRGDYRQLAERALELLRDPEIAGQMVERARKECSRYSWTAVREGWLNAYLNLANTGTTAKVEINSSSQSERNVLSR